ncbi:MAG: hypothetical protein NUW01_13420 [Gemmatimonadaceae bacterium]|nr:hypothetical protein [Gemmatimonadaceae bacterium]
MSRITFWDCAMECARTPSFVAEIDRLKGTSFATLGRRAPLVQMIDEATGHERAEIMDFLEVVHDLVYSRLPQPTQGERE